MEIAAKERRAWLGWGKPRGRQASRLWKLPLMLWKVEQNRHLARMRQASRQASRQALRLWKLQRGKGETWLRWGKTRGRPPHPYIHRFSHAWAKNLLHFSICACHPCAGAMLIFSVSLQFYRMIPEGNPLGSEQKRCLPCSSRHHQCHGWPFTIDIPLLAFFRPGLCPNVLHSAAVSSGSSMPHMHMPQAPKHAWQRHPTY